MNKIKQNKINFTLILVAITVTFSSLTILSLPALFNYNSKAEKIEKFFYQNFKLYLNTTGKISYKPFPKPHLLVENAYLNLEKSTTNNALIKTKNLKIFISLRDIYLRSFKNFSSTEIIDTNLEFQISNLKNIRDHIYKKINKPIILNNCKLFLKNKENDVILISPIEKVFYKIDTKNKYKNFLIDGKIFGINFKSDWKRNYTSPNYVSHQIELFEPNIKIENMFNYINNDEFKINSIIKYAQEKLEYEIKFNKSKIRINSPNKENINFKIDSDIQLKPFYFNGELTIHDKKIENIIDNIFLYMFLYDENYLGNINGNLKVKLSNLNNKLINKGEIDFYINE